MQVIPHNRAEISSNLFFKSLLNHRTEFLKSTTLVRMCIPNRVRCSSCVVS